MLAFERLQTSPGWSFDFVSALIGALIAWLVATLIYAYRKKLKQTWEGVWAPVAAWRRRVRASQEQKYLRALRPRLSSLLFLEPTNPPALICPPVFDVAAPLPSTISENRKPPGTIRVPYRNLFIGHPKIVVTGPQDSGRTTLMVIAALESYQPTEVDQDGSHNRLPTYIDLSHIDQLDRDTEVDPIKQLAGLAVLTMPELLTRWVIQHWTAEPSLILLDNWSSISSEDRKRVADWIEMASQRFEEVFWLVASDSTGYGALTEIGFVPASIVSQPDNDWLSTLIAGWVDLYIGEEKEDPQGDSSPSVDTLALFDNLQDILETHPPLWEYHLRTALFLRTQENAIQDANQQDVIERWIEEEIPLPSLGDEDMNQEAAELAHRLARQILRKLAYRQRIENQTTDIRELRDLVNTYLPEEEERHPKLESAVRHLILDAAFLERKPNKSWGFSHPIWTDYLTAGYLANAQEGDEVILDHLLDPAWSRIVDFYASQGNASDIVTTLLNGAKAPCDVPKLLRVTRWAINAPPEAPWRQTLMKALAQSFMGEETSASDRLTAGRALTQVAGKSARAFFIKMLQQPSLKVRATAIRGLGWCGNPQDMRILGAALQDRKPEVRRAAVRALSDMGTPGAAKLLAQNLDQVEERLMLDIAEALAGLPGGSEALIDATDHPDLLVRRAVAHGLGTIDENWAEEELLAMMKHDSEWLVRSAAESALEAKEEGEAAVIPAPPEVDQIEWLINWAAERGMGLGLGDAARETLVLAAKEGRDDVKRLSALTLARIGNESHIPVLESLLKSDTSSSVQTAAAQGLQELQRRYPNGTSGTEA